MGQIFSDTSFTIENLINDIETGQLGLPELQRPFVWKDTKVRDLFDSLMRGYPMGALMLWQCPFLEKKKAIGVGEHSYTSPTSVIIDGQQRLTSLYAVIKNKTIIDSNYKKRKIIISYHPLLNKFEVGYQATKNNREWIYDISEVYASDTYEFTEQYIENIKNEYVKKEKEFKREDKTIIAKNISSLVNLKQHTLHVFNILSDADEEAVSDIFVRVNSGGVKLKQNDFILTLMSLYWEDGRRKIEEFCKDSYGIKKDENNNKKITSYNSITHVDAQDIVRVIMAYAFNRAKLQYGYKLLRGAEFDKKGSINEELREQRFEILKNKLEDVLNLNNWKEFLKSIMNAGYHSGELILSRNAIFYSYSMYLIAKYKFKLSNLDNRYITSLWFYYANLVSLYTGSFETLVENHLSELKDIRTADEYRRFVLGKINSRLTNDYFEMTLTSTEGLEVSGRGNNAWNAYVAALVVLQHKVLFSKSSLLVSKLFEVDASGKRRSLEKHHLFPKAYLTSLGYTDKMKNQMANYAFIDWNDNMDILDESPASYYPKICKGKSEAEILQMEQENALPHGWENMKYDDFLVERRKLMALKIKDALNMLKKNAM